MFVISVFLDLTFIAQEFIFGIKCDSEGINRMRRRYRSDSKSRKRDESSGTQIPWAENMPAYV